jgi:hypothetical protein
MNRRVLFGGFLSLVCLATLWGVWDQRGQLAGLRAEQRQLQARLAASTDSSASRPSAEPARPGPATTTPALLITPELLRLRNEVTQLTERRRELAGARAENERLRTQLASRGTNGPAGFQLPPGYVRRSEARMVGYNTPEDTLQSLLWALQNHDLTNILQAFSPDRAEIIGARAGTSPESVQAFFKDAALLPGLRVVKREEDSSDNSVALDLEVIPGVQGPRVTFRQINGQWKIAGPF